MRRLSIGGLAFGLALLLAGCGSDGPAANGPFGTGGGTGEVCAWTTAGNVLTYGVEDLRNSGGTATINKIALVDPRHLRVVSAWAVPITGTNLLGVFRGEPPSGYGGGAPLAAGIQWTQRQPANGAVIPHSRGHDVTNLVLVLKPSGPVGTATAVDVYYTEGGTAYLLHWPIRMEVKVGRECNLR